MRENSGEDCELHFTAQREEPLSEPLPFMCIRFMEWPRCAGQQSMTLDCGAQAYTPARTASGSASNARTRPRAWKRWASFITESSWECRTLEPGILALEIAGIESRVRKSDAMDCELDSFWLGSHFDATVQAHLR